MEEVPAEVDLKRTRGNFLDAAERCIIFKRSRREEREGSSCKEMEGERRRERRAWLAKGHTNPSQIAIPTEKNFSCK